MSEFEKIIEDLRPKTHYQDGVYYYLQQISGFQKKEIEFHNKIHQDEIEIHQLNTVRNKYYHDYFKKFLYQLPKESIILEIGSGSGYDIKLLADKGYQLIVSDISEESVKSIKSVINNQYSEFNNQILYLVADGQNLPLPDNSVDAVFCVATFHHFQNQEKALLEISRVTKKGGLIILAMEPSRFMMGFSKILKRLKDLKIYEDYSIADETQKGFTKNDFKKLILNSRNTIQVTRYTKIKRVWLLLGFLHYKLEAIYRLFKLKKRIKVPRFIEWILLVIDEILFKIPIVNRINWHWIVIIKRGESQINYQ